MHLSPRAALRRQLLPLACAIGPLLIAQPVAAQAPAAPLPAPPPLASPAGPPVPAVKPLTAPGLLRPIAPGSLPSKPPLTTVQPAPPQAWTTFAQLRAEATGPTTARLAWLQRKDATHYRVIRDGAAVAELPAPASSPIEYIDSALEPGRTYMYLVEAMQQSGGGIRQAPIARLGQPAAVAAALPLVKPLEASNAKGVVTPSIDAPQGFSVTRLDPRQRTVRIAWTPPKWATGIQVLRDGAPIGPAVDPRATSFDDVGVAPGTHRYALQTLYAAAGRPPFASAPSAELSLRLAPLRILAFGDSIMWGQGLAEPAKFTSLARDALQRALGIEVELRSFAHSGAVLLNTAAPLPAIGQQEPTGFDQNRLLTPGEIPNGYPTILHQLNVQAPAAGIATREVDLILIDGCINDVGVTTILKPSRKPAEVSAITRAKCSAMAEVLKRAHEIYPNAAIVVTGYYPIVSPLSDLAALPIFVATAVGTAALAGPVVGLPPDPVSAVAAIAVALGATPLLRDSLSANSLAFSRTADATLAAVASTVSTQAQRPGLVTYVAPPFTDRNAYAAPDSSLWLVPTGLVAGDQDDVITSRTAQCRMPGVLDASIGATVYRTTVDEAALAAVKCPRASMGHPNRRGAQAYADAIVGALQAQLPRWRDTYAQSRQAARSP